MEINSYLLIIFLIIQKQKCMKTLLNKKFLALLGGFLFFLSVINFSCQKNISPNINAQPTISGASTNTDIASFNLEVILRGENGGFGHVKFRQDNDTARIIDLDTWVRNLEPNHSYLLQRAVDPIATGDCLSSAWLTLGKGLVSQAITTDDTGTGSADLWRAVTAIARGTSFYIHFRVIDAVTGEPVLTSDCYTYFVR